MFASPWHSGVGRSVALAAIIALVFAMLAMIAPTARAVAAPEHAAAGARVAAAPAAVDDPLAWECDAFGYLFQTATADSPDHTVTKVDLATGQYTPAGNTADQVNAVGYNTLDNFIYGWDFATNTLVKVNNDLTLTDLGDPAGVPAGSYNTGAFDDAGHLWITNNNLDGGPNWPWAEVDFAPGSPTYGTVLAHGTFPDRDLIPSDWVFIGGKFYGTRGVDVGTNRIAHLTVFDPSNHSLTDGGSLTGEDWAGGAGAIYTDGTYMYGSDNGSGYIYRIDPVTLVVNQLPKGPSAKGNDGARCATAPIPTITVTKTVPARITADDQFTVGLNNAGGDQLTSATTSGANTSAATTNWPVSQGATYTITDAMAQGAPDDFAKYTPSIACTDGDGNAVATGGSAPNWTIDVADAINYSCTVTNTITPTGELLIEKTSDATADSRIGDTVKYTVTAKNTGTGDYTVDDPAIVKDSLTGALDDATYAGDASASIGGSDAGPVALTGDQLSWTGPLAFGQTVTITYSVTLKAGGDGDVSNVAWGPHTPNGDVPTCDPRNADGTDQATGVPCGRVDFTIPTVTIDKKANTTELPTDGGTVDYTVTVTNNSDGDFTADAPATASDDLSNVLDDASYNDDAAASVGTVTFDQSGHKLNWSGVLVAGESATITYSVTYDANKSGGDHQLLNVVCAPDNLVQAGDNSCRSVPIPGAALQQRKSVDPASGTAVSPGQNVTYTLTFENTGQTDATVNTVDDLSGVLDDATMAGNPISSNPSLVATLTGDQLAITGTVPAGETYTVAYTVTVNAFADQGDHDLNNVLGGDTCAAGDTTCRTDNPVKHLTVTKIAVPEQGANMGDTVMYTVTATDDGAGDYTAADPAVVNDDLTGVLDDATFDQLSASATSGVLSYAAPNLGWSGALASGDSVTITYSVTVTNAGDHDLVNAAGVVCVDPVLCDPPIVINEQLPHVVPAKSSDPASGTGVQAGEVVTYTLSWTNDGQAAGVVDSTDDLSNVLDDADVTSEPVSSDAAVTATRTGDSIRIVGDIAAGATVTVTYQVTVKPNGQHGDDDLGNVLTPDIPQLCEDGQACPPPITDHPVGDLDDWKSVDPASGTTVQPGAELTYTLHFTNTGRAPVDVTKDDDLSGVVDDADVTAQPVASDAALTVSPIADGRFSVTGSLAADQTVTVTYQVTVKADGQRGDDQLSNFLLETGHVPPADCVPVDDQKPDCTVNYVSNVTVVKTSDPKSGTDVKSGQPVTYTLTFTNVGTNPKAAAVPVDEIDYMKDVLDDATLTSGPTASDAALVAKTTGDTIQVTGALASGQVARVTYTVKVKAYNDQGNHQIGNVVARNGDEPICVPDSQLCTMHKVTPPVPGLADTGSDVTTAGLLAALLAGLGGIGLLITRWRRRRVN